MKKLGLATALLLAMTGAQAYQFEVQGQSEYLDTTQNGKNFTGAAQGTFYVKDVDASKGPLAEAAFLNQASNVSVAYNFLKYDEKDGADFKSHNYGIKGEAYIPTPYVPAYASASYNHTLTEFKDTDSQYGYDDNGDRYALEVGAVLTPNFLVAVGYTNVPNQISLDTFGITQKGIAPAVIESAAAIQDKSEAVTARAKYVGPISGTNMSVGFETAATFGENTVYGMKTDLFLNPQLSVGATYLGSNMSAADNEFTFDQAWGGNVNYFITPAVAVGVSYVHANTKGYALDTDTVGLNAKFRF